MVRTTLLSGLLVLAGAVAHSDALAAQEVAGAGAATVSTASASTSPGSPDAAGHPEAPRPGDVLRLRIWREPDLSGEYAVDHQGQVTLPKLGPVRVDTVHADSLRAFVVRSYQVYLNNPSVEVTVLRRVAILGAVQKPGLYPVDPTMTVADALVLAGGSAADGKRDRVELRRGGERLEADLAQASRIAELAIRSGDQLYVPQRSWLSRNSWVLSTVIGAAATVTTILLTRGGGE